jgi:hypothetical protein
MRAEHDKLQEEYAQQEQQGGLSLLGIDPVKDKAAYDIQQNYITKTKEAADQLATKGFIDSGRRRGLMEVKSLYTNQVVPLQNQLATRNARAEELRKIQLSDPTFRANASPSDISLTEGLKSPTAFDYTGVSGSQLQSSVAKKAEQLGKTISQDHPELIHSKLFGQYFTALQSGASLAQVDNAMRKQFDPAKVDKMTGLLHGLVSSTLNEFGVPEKFKNNQATQDELWGTAAQGLYSAIGSKQFGQMTDSFAIDARKKALETQSQEPPGKTHKEYDSAFDEKNFKRLNETLNSANNTSKSDVTGFGPYGTQRTYNKEATDKARAVAQSEINKIAADLQKRGLLKVPQKIATEDLAKWNKSVIDLAKEDYKTANLSRHFFNPSGETIQKFNSALSGMDEITDVNGKEISRDKILSNGKLIGDAHLVRGVNGTTLKTIDKDGKEVSIPFDVAKLGATTLRDYDAQIQNIKSDMETMSSDKLKAKYKDPKAWIDRYESAIDDILTSEQYTQTKSQAVNPGYSGYGRQ